MTLLTVIIVNWNTREHLRECLETLQQELQRIDQPTETFVVDNGSTDDSAQMVKTEFGWVHPILNPKNVGFARANNQAIKLAVGEFVLLLNSDTAVHPNSLRNLVRFAQAHPQGGGFGARLLNEDGTLQVSCHPMLTPQRELWRLLFLDRLRRMATYPMHRWRLDQARQVEVIKGACLLIRKSALEQIGLLDERYFMYTEEVDLCYRLQEADWQLWFVPTAAITHYGEASSKQIHNEMYVQLYRSKLQFYRKVGGHSYERLFKWLMVIAYAPRMLFQPHLPFYRHFFYQLLKM